MSTLGSGPPNAKIMIVGNCYLDEDVRACAPFQGAPGMELNRMLNDAGILRSEVYLTNVINAQPRGGRLDSLIAHKKSDITAQHTELKGKFVLPALAQGYARLLKEIELVQPNVICSLDTIPTWLLTGAESITKWRGSHLRMAYGPKQPEPGHATAPAPKVIPTYPPSWVLAQWQLRPHTVEDLKRVKRESGTRVYLSEPKWNFTVRPGLAQVRNIGSWLLTQIDQAYEPFWLELDLETRAGHIACLGLSWSRTEAICIPFMCVENNRGYWDVEDEACILRLLRLILTHPNVAIRWQNGLYDAQYIWRHWHYVPRGVQDTMISHHTAFVALPKSLAFQASMYSPHYVYWKDDGKTWEPNQPEAKLWEYNCVDCVRTREVGEAELGIIEDLKLQDVDAFQQKLFWPVLAAMKLGVRVDTFRRANLEREIQFEIDERKKFLRTILDADVNLASSPQMQDLFYRRLGQPPVMSRAKRGAAIHVTCDDEALQTIAKREPLLKPIVNSIADIRTLQVFISTFIQAQIDKDGRMRSSFNIAGSDTGKSAPYTFRLSSSKNAFGGGCFPPGAEVLTETGWVTIESVTSGTLVAAYCSVSQTILWQEAEPYKEYFSGKLYQASSEQYYTKVTPGHRILATKAGRQTRMTYHAKVLASFSSQFKIPVSGEAAPDGILSFSAERLLVATLADGSYEDNRVRFSLLKNRKCTRLLDLCLHYGIPCTETKPSANGERRFWFYKPRDWPRAKAWGWWILWLKAKNASAMLDECRYWDATERGDSFIFFTADRKQAEIVQTLAHLTNKSATLRSVEQSVKSWSDTLMYWVNIKPRNTVGVEHQHWTTCEFKGDVYCLTVPSSYFLVRQRGKISITGNCNFQNIPSEKSKSAGKAAARGMTFKLPNMRSMYVPDPGYLFFDMDLDRADLQVVVWEADDAMLKAALRLGADIHLLNVYGLDGRDPPPLEELVEIHPKYPDHRGPRKHKREFAKVFCHATNYGGQARTVAAATGHTVAEVDRAQRAWFGAHPGIKRWHDRTLDQIQRHRFVENKFGYRWHIFDRLDRALPQALAWTPQSTVGCYINRIWVAIYEQCPDVQVLIQVHDSLAGQFPIAKQAECQAVILQASKIVIPYDDPLIIPVGIKTSLTSWGDCV